MDTEICDAYPSTRRILINCYANTNRVNMPWTRLSPCRLIQPGWARLSVQFLAHPPSRNGASRTTPIPNNILRQVSKRSKVSSPICPGGVPSGPLPHVPAPLGVTHRNFAEHFTRSPWWQALFGHLQSTLSQDPMPIWRTGKTWSHTWEPAQCTFSKWSHCPPRGTA